MSQMLAIARAVTEALADCDAELEFFPEFDLRDLEERRVVVVPSGTEYRSLARNTREELPTVQIGVLQRATEDDLPGLLLFTEQLGLRFLNRRFCGALCAGVAYDPIYSPEHLRERGQFVSVIELSFRMVR